MYFIWDCKRSNYVDDQFEMVYERSKISSPYPLG